MSPTADPLFFEGEALDFALREGVLEVRLHRPPCNEIGLLMLAELERLVAAIELRDPRARSVLITSDLERGFCAGADLRGLYAGMQELQRGNPDESSVNEKLAFLFGDGGNFSNIHRFLTALRRGGPRLGVRRARELYRAARGDRGAIKRVIVRRFLDRIHAVLDALDAAPVPTVAAVHGVVFGGGLELMLACDVVVADKGARFAFPELRLGLIPGFGGIPRLRRDLGNAIVRDLLLSGRSLGAQRAYEVGLVSQLAGHGRAADAARRLARQLDRYDAEVSAAAKRFLKPIPREALEEEKEIFLRLLESPRVERALARFVADDSAMPYLPPKPAASNPP